MLSPNQIPEFLNQLFLQNKSTKQPQCLHVDIKSQRLKVDQKFLFAYGQKWVMVNLASGLYKNEQMELTDFLSAGTNSGKWKDDCNFLVRTLSKMGLGSVVMGL